MLEVPEADVRQVGNAVLLSAKICSSESEVARK